MGEISQPVYRVGRILEGVRKLERREAKRVAKELCASAPEITKRVISYLQADPDNAALSFGQESGPNAFIEDSELAKIPVPKLIPTIIVDFTPFRMRIEDAVIECKFCITVCIGKKRSKCWQRFSVIEGEDSYKERFFDDARKMAKPVFEMLVDFYGDCIAAALNEPKPDFSTYYKLEILAATTNEIHFDEAYECLFEKRKRQNPCEIKSDLLLPEFQKLVDNMVELPKPGVLEKFDEGVVNQLIGFATRRSQDFSNDESTLDKPEKAKPLSPYGLMAEGAKTHDRDESKLLTTSISNDSRIKALVALNYDTDSATFICLGYDNEYHRHAPNRSLSHIISGEISVEYGRLY